MTSFSSKVCINIKTGEDQFNEGYIDVFVDSGTTGYVEVTTKDDYALGETVLDECYEDFRGIQVTSNNINAWVGSITSSVDNGATYLPMKCVDCDPRSTTDSTFKITVDGDFNSNTVLAPAECANGQIGYPGNNCTLVNVAPNIKINDSNVIGPDIMASNGIVHVIDKVLIQPDPEEACTNAIEVDVRTQNNGVEPTGGIVDGKTAESGTCGFPFFLDKSPFSWFKVIGTGNVLTASTCSEDSEGSTSVPTSVLVFSGCGDWTNDCVDGNQESEACAAITTVENGGTVSWSSEVNNIYFIQISSTQTNQQVGTFKLDVFETPSTGCSAATTIDIDSVTDEQTINGPYRLPPSPIGCGSSTTPNAPAIWYETSGTTGQVLTASTCPDAGGSADFETQLAVYTGCDIIGVDSDLCVQGAIDGPACSVTGGSTISWPAETGKNYRIMVADKSSTARSLGAVRELQSGTFTLSLAASTTSSPSISSAPSEDPSTMPSGNPTVQPSQVPSISSAPSGIPSANPTKTVSKIL